MEDISSISSTRTGRRERAAVPYAQRLLDITLIVVAAPVLILIAAAIALAIYLDSPGPVIYRSARVGRDGELFQMLKFRKMRADAHSDPLTLEDDERFTPIGRFLSRTRLDELPQIVNILRGEMRLVGPRPELECFVREFSHQYRDVLAVTPGLTGPSQLRFIDERSLLGREDPAATYTGHVLPVKIEIDLAYVRDHTVGGDLRIIARTVVLPARMLAERLRTGSPALAAWIPALVCAGLLATVFVVASSHLP
jgi:lipopolysaccharide/colanic/teichoic acid biosynthesis glycosyltransferase